MARITYFVGSLEAGGLERFVARVALRAKDQDLFEPIVCCLHKRQGIFLKQLEEVDIPVYQAPQRWERNLASLRAFGDMIAEIQPDLVHSQVNFSLAQQLVAVRRAGVDAFCVTERNQYTLHGWSRVRRVAQFHLLHLAGARYSANGRAVAEHLARQVRAPCSSIRVLPNGVDLIPPDLKTRAALRAVLGWAAEDVGLGYIARMAAHKGQANFLRALANLRDRGLAVKACLVGDGPQRPSLEKLVDELRLEEQVRLVGVVENVEDYLQAFDAVALFSQREGMPNAVLEAMAAAKPVVATPVGAIPELLDHGRAGIVVDPPSLPNLTEALELVVRDESLRNRLGEAACMQVQNHYSLDVISSNLSRYYAALIGQGYNLAN